MAEVPRVMVAVRVRPILKSGGSALQCSERFSLECATKLDDCALRLQEQKTDEACRSSTFTFDFIFDQDSTQHEVYEDAVVDLIDAALCGCNTTILAYGQTGSGKTHTVLGEVKDNPLEQDLLTANTGLFMRSIRDLIEYKKKREKHCHVILGLSCIEIYNEAVRDLLSSTPMESIKVVMDDEGVYMPTLSNKEIVNLQSVYAIFKMAQSRRQTRATEANDGSSRSHCLFVVDILQQELQEGTPPPSLDFVNQIPTGDRPHKAESHKAKPGAPANQAKANGPTMSPRVMDFTGLVIKKNNEPNLFVSKIVFGDLAGSEKLKTSGATGAGRTETVSINSSLTALGNVVHALHEGSKHVPYRDSKLTSILRSAFNHPSARVLLMAAVAPTQLTYDESISTCHFANKVKAMKVVSQINAETQNLLHDYLEALKLDESLIADMRIAKATHNYQTVIRRARPDLCHVPFWWYKSQAGPNAKQPQRVQFLKDQQFLDFAEKDKARIAAVLREEEEREAAELRALCDRKKQEFIEDHNVAVKHLAQESKEMDGDNAALRAELDKSHSFIDAQRVHEEKEVADLMREVVELTATHKTLVGNTAIAIEIMEKTANELSAKHAKTPAGQAPAPAALLPGHEDDLSYAALTQYHLSAQRFCQGLLVMRQHQQCLFNMRRFTGELAQVALSNAMKLMDVLPSNAKAQERKPSTATTTTTAAPPQPAHQVAAVAQQRTMQGALQVQPGSPTAVDMQGHGFNPLPSQHPNQPMPHRQMGGNPQPQGNVHVNPQAELPANSPRHMGTGGGQTGMPQDNRGPSPQQRPTGSSVMGGPQAGYGVPPGPALPGNFNYPAPGTFKQPPAPASGYTGNLPPGYGQPTAQSGLPQQRPTGSPVTASPQAQPTAQPFLPSNSQMGGQPMPQQRPMGGQPGMPQDNRGPSPQQRPTGSPVMGGPQAQPTAQSGLPQQRPTGSPVTARPQPMGGQPGQPPMVGGQPMPQQRPMSGGPGPQQGGAPPPR